VPRIARGRAVGVGGGAAEPGGEHPLGVVDAPVAGDVGGDEDRDGAVLDSPSPAAAETATATVESVKTGVFVIRASVIYHGTS
ncbi:MAG: hypothetical protein ACR2J8_14390, partial [Thermomicrobiales bacterium]